MSEVENKETPVEDAPKDYVEDGKNKLIVKCKFCGSKILEKKTARYVAQEVSHSHFLQHFIIAQTLCQSWPEIIKMYTIRNKINYKFSSIFYFLSIY
jgi:hypothetical protein